METDVMLVSEYKEPNFTKGRYVTQIKYNGVRCKAIATPYEVTLYSRDGSVYDNFPAIEASLMEICKEHELANITLDGEIIMDSFQELSTQLHRKENVNTASAKYMVFDLLSHQRDPACHELVYQIYCSYDYRLRRVEYFLDTHPKDNIKLVLCVPASTEEDVQEAFQAAIEAGEEGIVVRNLDAPYEFKRSKFVMKLKQKDSVVLPIVDVIEGKGKLSGSCGQVICEGNDKDRFYKVSVSGQTMCKETRDLLWEQWTSGFTVPEIRIMGDCTMENIKGAYHTLRHPRFDAYIWR